MCSSVAYLLSINILKTIYINFVYFGWLGIIHFPIIVHRGVCLKAVCGTIVLDIPIRPRIILIGAGGVGTIDFRYERTEWNVRGEIIVKGQVSIGKGCRISVGEDACLTFNGDIHISGRSSIICEKAISFGRDCLLSWDILIMDSDFHFIYDKEGSILNAPKIITIGNHVWIGCRCTVLKGVTIADDVILAAGSLVTSMVDSEKSIYGGTGRGLRKIRDGVNWSAINN